MKNKKLIAISFFMLCILSSCKNTEFEKSYKQVKESYILATEFLDADSDALKAIKTMDIDAVENELNKMKEIIDNLGEKANSNGDKDFLEQYHQGAESLLEIAKNPKNLTVEEKRQFYSEAVLVKMHRDLIKRGEE